MNQNVYFLFSGAKKASVTQKLFLKILLSAISKDKILLWQMGGWSLNRIVRQGQKSRGLCGIESAGLKWDSLFCCHQSSHTHTHTHTLGATFQILFWSCVVQLLSCVWLCAAPWTAAHQASLSFTISQSSLRCMPIESVMLSNHLILCHPLLVLPPISSSIRLLF